MSSLVMPEPDAKWVIGPQPGPQTILMSTDIEEIFFGGALAAGKSYALALDFARHHQRFGQHVAGLILRRSVPELKQLIKIFKSVLTPFGWIYKVGEKTFVNPDGATCRMGHCDDEDDVSKYWGQDYTYIGVDELGDMPPKTFDAVKKLRAARLRSAEGVKIRFVATGNPCGKGHRQCKERYIDPAPPFTPFRDPDSKHWCVFIPGRMEDNIKMLMNDPDYAERCKSMGPKWYVDALIQGDWSKSPEGNLFERPWFGNRFDLGNPPPFWAVYASWDTAFKTTKESARSACTVWGVNALGYYLLYAFAKKIEFPELKRTAVDISRAYRCACTWVEDKASGISLVQALKEDNTTADLTTTPAMPVKAIKVDGDKLRRAFAVTTLFESGKVFLPMNAPWVHEYVEELCAFPAPTELCDYVDSTSQALTELRMVQKRREKFTQYNSVPLTGSIYEV